MKRLALLAALLLPLSMAFAQQNVGFKTDKVEPLVINPDNSVTFYVEAPKAKSVSVKGDWEANEGNGQMTKEGNTITETVLDAIRRGADLHSAHGRVLWPFAAAGGVG